MNKKIKNHNVLITAGPTFVSIDKVRFISNISTGRTGLGIAKYLSKQGFRVTLMINPAGFELNKVSGIKIIRFKFYEQFLKDVIKEIKSKKYQTVIHSAAVSDYLPIKVAKGKIPSGRKHFKLEFKPTTKIIKLIRKIDSKIFLVQFKLESGNHKELINKAFTSLKGNKSNLVIANLLEDIEKGNFKRYIIDKAKRIKSVKNRYLAKELMNRISK